MDWFASGVKRFQIVVLVIGLVSLVTSVLCYVKIYLRLQGNQATIEDSSGGLQSNEDEEVSGGRATEDGVGEMTGAGKDTEEEAGAGTGRATDEKSLSPKYHQSEEFKK